MTLKKLVELVKLKSDESEEFLYLNSNKIFKAIIKLLDKNLCCQLTFEVRAKKLKENFDRIKAMLEYIQKICSCQAMLRSLPSSTLSGFVHSIVDCLATVSSDKKILI